MSRKLPVLPTLVVLVAVGIMLRLGFWQVERLHQKEAMLARYAAASAAPGVVPWHAAGDAGLYQRSALTCAGVAGMKAVAGQNAAGEAGYAHIADCVLAGGAHAAVVLGWSREPASPTWRGGNVTGMIAPGPRLVADPPQAGLQANARPDPRDIPNNHLAYAVQWFAFAGVALIIYVLALRKRR